MFFHASMVNSGHVLIIEADTRETAAAVAASAYGDHPDTISCPCCGPHGSCYELPEAEVLEAIAEEYPPIIFQEEHTAEDAERGRSSTTISARKGIKILTNKPLDKKIKP